MDRVLHSERLHGRLKRKHPKSIEDLPDGAMIEFDGFAWAVRGKSLLRWTPAGYRERRRRPAESKSQCSHRPLLLRSLPVAVLAVGYRPQWHPSGAGKRLMTENCVSFGFPIYRDGKTARLLPSRYIGTGKLRDFCLPDISGRENCASFAFPIYRDGKTARVLSSRYIGTGKLRDFCLPDISGRENCATFAFPIYRDGKTARLLLSRYIGS